MTNNEINRKKVANLMLDDLEKHRGKILEIILEHWAHHRRNDFGDVLEHLEDLGDLNPFEKPRPISKQERLMYAIQNYPEGTIFETAIQKLISTGVFTAWQEGFHKGASKDSIWRVNEAGEVAGMVYDGHTMQWAEIIETKNT